MEALKNIFIKIAIFDLKAIAIVTSCYLLVAIVGKILNSLHRKGLMINFYKMLNNDFSEIMYNGEIMDFFLYVRMELWRYLHLVLFPALF